VFDNDTLDPSPGREHGGLIEDFMIAAGGVTARS
jgi:hypothetical protein